ncbi:hypothetical protein BDB00DRAFT_323681 [Zychaea mexicana]|uniref:uncharacterized protein n=1 Tax=Zychaea mexicana TaxID=64656 RepID=UPI0022FE431B|nr:uncharacterized protein BDB00DRAFT_323681 [Zychaea mexicana]KAI9498867.1 hypothetical protein BDB00DRAFT_323681 [Zychaea mexicana]
MKRMSSTSWTRSYQPKQHLLTTDNLQRYTSMYPHSAHVRQQRAIEYIEQQTEIVKHEQQIRWEEKKQQIHHPTSSTIAPTVVATTTASTASLSTTKTRLKSLVLHHRVGRLIASMVYNN